MISTNFHDQNGKMINKKAINKKSEFENSYKKCSLCKKWVLKIDFEKKDCGTVESNNAQKNSHKKGDILNV